MSTLSPLHLYRGLIRLARRLPFEQQLPTLSKIKDDFRETIGRLADDQEMIELRKKGESNMAYLKMITPRVINEVNDAQYFTIVDGKLVNGVPKDSVGGKPVTNWTGTNMDPDSVARHYSQLRRAGFKNNLHCKGFF